MKSLRHVLLLFALAFLMGCEDEIDPLEGALIEVTYEGSTTPIQVKLVDAKTKQVIGFDGFLDIEVSVEGEGASQITDTWGIQKETYESEVGFISLAVDPNITPPGESNPIRISVQAKATGYVDTGKSVAIVSEGPQFVIIHMVKKSDTPDGVEYVSDDVSNALNDQGVLQQTLEMSVPGNKAKITLPEEMVMLDASGAPLSGSISMEMTYFDNTEQDALLAYPGGFLTQVNFDNSLEDGMFYTAGFAAIEITDQNGNEAATFQQGSIELEMIIDESTFNPETSSSVSAGDEVGVYSYEPENGEWTFENNITVESEPSGLMATTQLSHLSWYNIDWWTSSDGGSCNNSQQAAVYFTEFLGDCADEYDSIGVYLEYIAVEATTQNILGIDGGWFVPGVNYALLGSWSIPQSSVSISWLTDDQIPCGAEPEVQIAGNPLLLPDACDISQSVGTELAIQNCGDLITVNVDLLCLAENLEVNFTNYPWLPMKESGCSDWEYHSINNTSFTFVGDRFASYDFWIEGQGYYNLSIPDTFDIAAGDSIILNLDVEIPDDACGLLE